MAGTPAIPPGLARCDLGKDSRWGVEEFERTRWAASRSLIVRGGTSSATTPRFRSQLALERRNEALAPSFFTHSRNCGF